MSFELKKLRHVLALAEHGNFARAAEALRLSQPALSRSIQRVEQVVGTQIFLRSSTGTVPTDIGRLFIERARQVVEMADALNQQALGDRTLRPGRVSVGAGPFPGQSMLSMALARFIGIYPRVNTQLRIADWDDLLRGLRHREVDFFVAEISTLKQEFDLEIEPMPRHPLYFAARAGHPLARHKSVTAGDTFAYPLVSLSRIAPRVLEPMRAAQRRSSDPVAASRAFPAAECNSVTTVTQVVCNSDAIMVTNLSCIARELEHRELVVLGSEPWLFLGYGLVRLKGQPMTALAGAFREFVLAAERATVLEEETLIARWTPGAAGAGIRRRAARPRRKFRRAHAG